VSSKSRVEAKITEMRRQLDSWNLQQRIGVIVPDLEVARENWIESFGVGSCRRELD
jgi:hypothetical protein